MRTTERLDSRSRRKSFRNTRECQEIEGNEGMVYIASGQEEKILYRLGLVPLYTSEENEDIIYREVLGQDIQKYTKQLVYEKKKDIERKRKREIMIEKMYKTTYGSVDIEKIKNEEMLGEIKTHFYKKVVDVKYYHPGYVTFRGELHTHTVELGFRKTSYVCYKFNGTHRHVPFDNLSFVSSIIIDITELFTPRKSREDPLCKWGIMDDVRSLQRRFKNNSDFPSLQKVVFEIRKNFSQYHLRLAIIQLLQIFPIIQIIVNVASEFRVEKTRNIRTLERVTVNRV